jgi:hypothetical protein
MQHLASNAELTDSLLAANLIAFIYRVLQRGGDEETDRCALSFLVNLSSHAAQEEVQPSFPHTPPTLQSDLEPASPTV